MDQATPDPAPDDTLDGKDIRITVDGVQDTEQELHPAAPTTSLPDRIENADS